MSSNRLTIQTPAKLNLFFELHGKRTDGYHNVETVTLPVRLFDTLVFERTDSTAKDVELTLKNGQKFGVFSENIPTDGRNLVVRAAKKLTEQTGVFQPTRIELTKRIPSEAGLGGGSSDAAATLIALNRLWNTGLSDAELRELAGELGSDVPLFFEPGAALGRGRGEKLEPVPCAARLAFTLIKPAFGLSTAEVYAASRTAPESERKRVEPLLNALRTGDLDGVAAALFNRLEEAAFSLRPELAAYLARLQDDSILAGRMTGSGTVLFALCREEASAERLAARFPDFSAAAVAGIPPVPLPNDSADGILGKITG